MPLIYPLFCNLNFEVDPTLDAAELEKDMITWGLEHFRQLKRDDRVDVQQLWIPIVVSRTGRALSYCRRMGLVHRT